MILKINTDNCEVIESDIVLKEGINVVGEIRAYMPEDNLLVPWKKENLESLLLKPEQLDGDYALIEIRNGEFFRATIGTSIEKDLFYFLDSQILILSDNFWKIVTAVKRVSIDDDAESFFMKHGYFRPAETFFKEIRRSRVLTYLKISNSKIIEQSIYNRESKKHTNSLESFKVSLNSVFETFEISNEDCILLSGGVDSGLITALAFIRYNASPKLATMVYDPIMEINNQDLKVAEKIANFYDKKLSIVAVDFSRKGVSDLDEVIRLMPLAAHQSLAFVDLMKHASYTLSTNRIWCGQNADNLYNLGPTGRFQLFPAKGWGQAFKRFLLSKSFIRSFRDVRPTQGYGAKLLGLIINEAFSLKEGKKYRLPRTAYELVQAFRESESYTPLIENELYSTRVNSTTNEFKTTLEVRNLLFDEKVQSYTIGRDSRIIISSSNMNSLKCVLPYSSANLLHFFRNMELTWKDVFHRKRYIVMYLRELLGKHNFNRLYSGKEKNCTGMNYDEWQKYILTQTNFGRELTDSLRKKTEDYSLQHLLSNYWVRKVYELLEDRGVKITREAL